MSDLQDQLANVVISLAGRYRSQAELSMHEMLKQTGYPERRATLTMQAIRKALASHPERLHDWLQYSADKRSSGWYLQRSDGQFEVGNVGADGSVVERRSYSEPEEACGDFVFHELSQIALE